MATNTTYTVRYRRVRTGQTNYKTRLKLLLSRKPRLVIRKSLKTITIQLTTYQQNGDKVLISVNSRKLADYGWQGSTNNTPAAYLTGLLVAKQAKAKNITECICDTGDVPSTPGSTIFAALAGAIDGGLNIPANKKVFPSPDRISGKHIANYAKDLKTKHPTTYQRQFTQYLKVKLDPEKLPEHFSQVKQKITHG